jgi:hypothetical protein
MRNLPVYYKFKIFKGYIFVWHRPELKIHTLFWVIIAFLGREAPQKTHILYPELAEFKFRPMLYRSLGRNRVIGVQGFGHCRCGATRHRVAVRLLRHL